MEAKQIDYKSIMAEYRVLMDRADKLSDSIREDARRTCKLAGLDPTLLGIHPHNAMVGYNYGKPWPNVNYSLVRKTLWLIEKSYEPARVVRRWYCRQVGLTTAE